MAESYGIDYLPLPDESYYTRAPLRASLSRGLQLNAEHFHGVKIRQLVADQDIWHIPGAVFSTNEVEYLVTVSQGATQLWGTIVWLATTAAENVLDNGVNLELAHRVEVRFYSERGGAGVAAGLDGVTSGAYTDSMAVVHRSRFRMSPQDFLMVQIRDQGVTDFPYVADVLGPEGATQWLTWSPTLTTSHEQRIQVQIRNDSPIVERVALWGVQIYEMVPQR